VDVWATVACLYYLLTRKTPRNFSGKDPLLAVLQTNPIPIRQYNPNVPEKLAELIDFALMDYPQLRVKNAIAFKQALLSVV
ncbi:MAG: serine/threonine protein kinase, partial [Chroococcales cyanobacterium]